MSGLRSWRFVGERVRERTNKVSYPFPSLNFAALALDSLSLSRTPKQNRQLRRLQNENHFLPTAWGISWNRTASDVLSPSAAELEKAAPIASPSLAVCNNPPNTIIQIRALLSLDTGCLCSLSVPCCISFKFSQPSGDIPCEWEWPP